MKHLFKIPQKKGKSYICNSQEKICVELNEIKIKNIKQLGETGGYYLECIIPNKNNKEQIDIVKNVDNDAKNYMAENHNETPLNTYINSYDTDDNTITIILSNKIETEIYINEEEKEINEIINFLLLNKKNKNLLINIDIIFLGIYINKDNIINKWGLKYINIEELTEFNTDWNKEEIEEEWKYDLIHYEEEVNNKIEKLKRGLNDARTLYNEIINENNIKIWENKIDKLKNNILSIYDNR